MASKVVIYYFPPRCALSNLFVTLWSAKFQYDWNIYEELQSNVNQMEIFQKWSYLSFQCVLWKLKTCILNISYLIPQISIA